MSTRSSTLSLARRNLIGKALICDIDGTVADDVRRRHLRPLEQPHCLVGVSEAAIQAYMAPRLVALDSVVPHARSFLLELAPEIVYFVSARRAQLANITAEWLGQAGLVFGAHTVGLLLRADSDARPSIDVKTDLAQAIPHQIGAWIDDHPAMLRRASHRFHCATLLAPHCFTED